MTTTAPVGAHGSMPPYRLKQQYFDGLDRPCCSQITRPGIGHRPIAAISRYPGNINLCGCRAENNWADCQAVRRMVPDPEIPARSPGAKGYLVVVSWKEAAMEGGRAMVEYKGDPIDYPLRRTDIFLPPDYSKLRAECPVAPARFPNGTRGWLVTRYEDVKKVCSDPRFSADTTLPGFPQIYAGQDSAATVNRSLVAEDPPTHGEHRRMVMASFTVKASEKMRPAIADIVNGLIDRLVRLPQPVDLVSEFALPIPITVVCRLLGFPLEGQDFIAERTNVRLAFASTAGDTEQATRELQDYIAKFIVDKEKILDNDLTSSLITEHLHTGELTRDELIDMLQLLLVAGHETTANALSLSIVTLLSHNDALAEILADRGMIVNAVEELLRYLSVSQTTVPRLATADLEIAGREIRSGEGVRALTCSANYDESVFPNPERFDVHRGSRNHLAFGYGIHNCLGQTYARIELQEGLWSLFSRLHNLQLAVPIEDLDVKWDYGVHGLNSLPVTWDSFD
jgi:cytochrome P450